MVNQKAISVRVYYDVLAALDAEAALGTTRGSLINHGARCYIELLDALRKEKLYNDTEVSTEWLAKWISIAKAQLNYRL